MQLKTEIVSAFLVMSALETIVFDLSGCHYLVFIMGLDATVRCRCFEEGRLKPGPLPIADLYIDDEGYLSSRKLDEARKMYDLRRFDARYGKLQGKFYAWSHHCCEHEDCEYCNEWVSNWGGCARFNHLVEEAGGIKEFPLLSNLIPKGNGMFYPAEKASEALKELDRFTEEITRNERCLSINQESPFLYEGRYLMAERIRNLLVASIKTGNPIRWL